MKCFKTTLRKNILKIAFNGHVEARNLAAAQSEILKRIKKSPTKVIVELGKYEKIDFGFIQLLLTMKNGLEAKNLDVEFNLTFSEGDTALLSRLNIINLLQIKSKK